uniref:Uncharacterized protein n=1 Tax=Arundo donax TaxID=35708 RepID=A0A0A9BEZ1_ARUDO
MSRGKNSTSANRRR